MADGQQGFNGRRMVVLIVLAVAVLAVAAWQLGYFEPTTPEGVHEADVAGVTDQSGGELIVTDPNAPQVEDVTIPETPMTPVPPGSEASPAPSDMPAAE